MEFTLYDIDGIIGSAWLSLQLEEPVLWIRKRLRGYTKSTTKGSQSMLQKLGSRQRSRKSDALTNHGFSARA